MLNDEFASQVNLWLETSLLNQFGDVAEQYAVRSRGFYGCGGAGKLICIPVQKKSYSKEVNRCVIVRQVFAVTKRRSTVFPILCGHVTLIFSQDFLQLSRFENQTFRRTNHLLQAWKSVQATTMRPSHHLTRLCTSRNHHLHPAVLRTYLPAHLFTKPFPTTPPTRISALNPPRTNPHGAYYQTHGRALFKCLTLAFLTYQIVYWTWLTLETEEIKGQKNREIRGLEGEVRSLEEGRKVHLGELREGRGRGGAG